MVYIRVDKRTKAALAREAKHWGLTVSAMLMLCWHASRTNMLGVLATGER